MAIGSLLAPPAHAGVDPQRKSDAKQHFVPYRSDAKGKSARRRHRHRPNHCAEDRADRGFVRIFAQLLPQRFALR
jgi:hypothetical protein